MADPVLVSADVDWDFGRAELARDAADSTRSPFTSGVVFSFCEAAFW